jgi:hypothetical protein
MHRRRVYHDAYYYYYNNHNLFRAIPAIMGVLIGNFGSDYLPYSVIFCTAIMFILYGIVVTITPYTKDNDVEIKEVSINIEKETL